MANDPELTDVPLNKTANPLVFVSHDTRDADLAEAFSNLLKSVSAGVLKSFRTSDKRGNQGIEYGIEWYPEIIRNIQSASDVVCLLTERSVDRPWILFEAGMAKGKLDTPILGVAIGIELRKVSTGPFAQFQNCGDDEESLTKLVFQLVNRIPGSEPDRDTIKFQVGKFKKAASEILAANATASSKGSEGKPDIETTAIENSSAKLFEEIKIMFQDLPSRIDARTHVPERKLRRRLSPGLIEEVIIRTKSPALGVRIGLSLMGETFPWMFHAGSDLLNRILGAKSKETRLALIEEMQELLMVDGRNPYLEKLFVNSEDDFRLMREVPQAIMHALMRLAERT